MKEVEKNLKGRRWKHLYMKIHVHSKAVTEDNLERIEDSLT